MKVLKKLSDVANLIIDGKVGVMPTDTIYGLVGQAFNENAVKRLYDIKGRESEKVLIMLISDISDIEKYFNVEITDKQRVFLDNYWPGKVSVGFPASDGLPRYISRGFSEFTARLPDYKELTDLISKTGPIFATSANISGQKPVKSIGEAQNLFGNKVDFYVDGGELLDKPSSVYSLKRDGSFTQVR